MATAMEKDLAAFLPERQYLHYYTKLTPALQRVYVAMLKGFLAHKDRIPFTAPGIESISEVHEALDRDIPELFFVRKVQVTFNPSLGTGTVEPEYDFDRKTCVQTLQRIKARTQDFLRGITAMNELLRAKAIHDYLIRASTYKNPEASYTHNITGALLHGITVCEGMAKAFKYLADRAGLRSMVAVGWGKANPDKSKDVQHAWNIVYVNGTPYHLDATFDMTVSNGPVVRYDYFLLSDKQVRVDHCFEDMPSCFRPMEYYRLTGQYAYSEGALESLVKHKLCLGKPMVVKLPELRESAEKIGQRMRQIVSAMLAKYHRTSGTLRISYNKERMILQIDLI